MNEKSLRNETYILLLEKEEMNLKKTEDDFYHFFFLKKLQSASPNCKYIKKFW